MGLGGTGERLMAAVTILTKRHLALAADALRWNDRVGLGPRKAAQIPPFLHLCFQHGFHSVPGSFGKWSTALLGRVTGASTSLAPAIWVHEQTLFHTALADGREFVGGPLDVRLHSALRR